MGSEQSKPKKFHITPPRIFIDRNYLKFSQFTSGRLAHNLVSEYIDSKHPVTVEILLNDEVITDINQKVNYSGDISISQNIEKKNGVDLNAIGVACVEGTSGKVVLSSKTGFEFELEHQIWENDIAKTSCFFALNSKDEFSKDNCRAIAGVGFEQSSSPSPSKSSQQTTNSEVQTTVENIPSGSKSKGGHNPAVVDIQPGLTPKVFEFKPIIPYNLNRYSNKVFFYAGIHPLHRLGENRAPIVGSQFSFFSKKILTEFLGEYNIKDHIMETTNAAISYVGVNDVSSPEFSPPEFSVAFHNLQNIIQTNPRAPPKVILSFYKHLSNSRRIVAAVDQRFKLITNYVDFGVELEAHFPDGGKLLNLADNDTLITNTNASVVAQWQLNKNNLLKAKVDQNSVGANYTFKSWWQPRFSASISATYNWMTSKFTPGFWIVLDNSDLLIHEKAKPFSSSVVFSNASEISDSDQDLV